jgi:hypothetical protein
MTDVVGIMWKEVLLVYCKALFQNLLDALINTTENNMIVGLQAANEIWDLPRTKHES